ncbi:MAG TPA: membrane protein insertion efficiency factor YidD [Buchnera sp. (in: enterobacteria)]|nr:membrane protein insertion efficiency factor YidD [Buchnera sp. (in: enterobacteria)]
MVRLSSIMSQCLIFIILIYQYCISIFIQPCCRFDPTCSQYAMNVIKKFGLKRGIYLFFRRILTCHPFYVNNYKVIVKKLADKREYK